MGRGPLGSKRRVAEGETEPEEEEEESAAEYEVEEVRDHIASSRGSRLALFGSDLRLGRFRPRRRTRRRLLAGEVGAVEGFFHDLVIHPDNKYVINSPAPSDLVNLVSKLQASASGFAFARARWLLLLLEGDGGGATRRARSVGVPRSDGSHESTNWSTMTTKTQYYFFVNIKNLHPLHILCVGG